MSQIMPRETARSLFDELFNDFFNRSGWPQVARSTELPSVVRARMDVIDKGGQYTVSVDLPGVRKEDIQVSVEGPRVSIVAENKGEREVKSGEKVLHTERFASSYARSFELPAEVSGDGAEAAFENGVLRLTLPKRTQSQSKKLTIR